MSFWSTIVEEFSMLTQISFIFSFFSPPPLFVICSVAKMTYASELCEKRIAVAQRCVASGPEGEQPEEVKARCGVQLAEATRCISDVIYK